MPRIVLEVPVENIALEQLRALPGVAFDIVEPHKETWTLPPEIAAEVDILLCKLPPSNLDACRRLKLIQISSVGYEHLRHFDFVQRPIRVCNARGIFDSAIAEWNVAMMINLARDLRGMIRNQEQGVWQRATRFQQEVRGQVVGLWGYGGIGRETARLAKALGMEVHALTRSPIGPRLDAYTPAGTGDPEGKLPARTFLPGAEMEFLRSLDFLILALPHTKQSDGMIGERELRALKPSAFLLNPARGPIIQEQPLIRALKENRIAGAALDTHYAYPLPPEHPLWRLPNVILTPHISGADKSGLFPGRIGELFVENVTRYLAGSALLNELTRREWLEA